MCAVTRRLDALSPVLVDCDCGNRRERGRGAYCGYDPCRLDAVGRATAGSAAPFAELVEATRGCSEGEADWLL